MKFGTHIVYPLQNKQMNSYERFKGLELAGNICKA